MKIERRDRVEMKWVPYDTTRAIECIAGSNSVSLKAVTSALNRGKVLSTEFADYRKSI